MRSTWTTTWDGTRPSLWSTPTGSPLSTSSAGGAAGRRRSRTTRKSAGRSPRPARSCASSPSTASSSRHPEALAPLGRDHLRVPRGIPHDLYVGVRDAGEVEQLHAGVGGDRRSHPAALRGERHLDV